jgi:hypothetical protein
MEMLQVSEFQLWADSFHEGNWACEALSEEIVGRGGSSTCKYEDGYIPVFEYTLDQLSFRVTVLGNYASWSPRPDKLNKLLAWGKPDLVLVDALSNEILFAVEETAATPTGNQALQRCERQFGAAIEGFPFWYLIAEYGIHSDGGTRRDSLWPTLMGLEMMHALAIPSIVLHYSDAENPEDYSLGSGMQSLVDVMCHILLNASNKDGPLSGLESVLKDQIDSMEKFVQDSWRNSLLIAPPLEGLNTAALSSSICNSQVNGNQEIAPFLNWPLSRDLSSKNVEAQQARSLVKHDDLAQLLEHSVGVGDCYGIIKGSGSKPQKEESLKTWIESQNLRQKAWVRGANLSAPKTNFEMHIGDFPLSKSGNRHVITAPRILYLFDETSIVDSLLKQAFPRLCDTEPFEQKQLEKPALLYISNSVKPGRIFGDPYTGQLSAYSISFGALARERTVIAYFPHQSIAQAAISLAEPNNKGLRIFAELTDLLVFGGGYAIKTKSLGIL